MIDIISVIGRVKSAIASSSDDSFYDDTEIIEWLDESVTELEPYIPEEVLGTDFYTQQEVTSSGTTNYVELPSNLLRLKSIERIKNNIYIPSDILDYNDFISRKHRIINVFNNDFPTSYFHAKVGDKVMVFPDLAVDEDVLITYIRKHEKRTNTAYLFDAPDYIVPVVTDYAIFRCYSKNRDLNNMVFYRNRYDAFKNKLMGIPYQIQPPKSGATPSDLERMK